MMPPPQGSGRACGLPCVKMCILLLAFGLAAYILGPPLYWRFVEGFAAVRRSGSCSTCVCDCPAESTPVLPPGLGDNSTDCTKIDPKMREELDKSYLDLLIEELKLQAVVANETQQKADSALLEAKKLSSQYQKEAEKCNIGMETCEGAREKAQEALMEQKKLSATWERRARDLGWKTGDKTIQEVV